MASKNDESKNLKKCSKCGIEKELSEFYEDKRAKDGLQSHCKGCFKEYWDKNKEKTAKRMKEYRARPANREKLVKREKEYNLKNKEKIAKRRKKYWEKNKEKIVKQRKEFRERLGIKEKIKEYQQQPEIKARTNTRQRTRRKTNINFRIKCNLGTRIWWSLKNNSKSKSTMKLLGCTIEQLKQHLEEQFTEGMSWDNYGKWHVDHIKPCILFNLSEPEEQSKCFHWSNLQPLWAVDNLEKSDKYEEVYGG